MAIIKKRAVIRRVLTNPITFAYLWEAFPYGAEVEVADVGNTAAQAYNEVGALSVSTAPASGFVVKATVEFEYLVPDTE